MGRTLRRVLTGVTLGVSAAALIAANGAAPPGWVPLGAAFVLALVGGLECARMGSLTRLRVGPVFVVATLAAGGTAAAVLLELPGLLAPGEAPLFALGLYVVAALAALPLFLFEPPEDAPPRGLGFVLVLWIVPVPFLWIPLGVAYGTAGLTALVALSKIGDVFGYFLGRALGRRHPFPRLSPGKTVAGCVASLVAGTVAGALVVPATLASTGGPGTWLSGALLGAGINVAAQAGDLAESWVKRRSGVKDSSALMGAAGGVLDVIDSLLFTTPVALLTWGLVG